MKIAVATDDFNTVTGHVGRCNGFLVIELDDNKIIKTEERENRFTNHKLTKNHDHSHGHSHTGLVEGLSDCSHLICTAAGWRLQEDLKNAGINLIFTNENNAKTAALKFAEGKLELNPEGVCHSH